MVYNHMTYEVQNFLSLFNISLHQDSIWVVLSFWFDYMVFEFPFQ